MREKVEDEHGLKLSYSWMKMTLQGAGLLSPLDFETGDRPPEPCDQ